MTVEEVLIDLGEQRLRGSGYSKVLHAMLNAYLPGDRPVNHDMTGHEILAMVYQLPSTDLQEKILAKGVGTVRNSDSYRTAVLIVSGILGMLTMLLAYNEITQTNTAVPGGSAALVRGLAGTSLKLIGF